ncbi:trypsin-like peptidase domain-containing protein [Candidatus Latescibacterota bacterium]
MKTSLVSPKHHIFFTLLFFLVFSTVPSYAALPGINSEQGVESPFAKVYEKVAPSIVKINVESKVTVQKSPGSPWDYFFNNPRQQQEREVTPKGMGSGVIVDREGYILTNNHVIENRTNDSVADKITVKINDAEEYSAEVIGRDPQTDLAIIKLELDGKKLPEEYIAELGDSDTIKPGDYAIAIGNPIGLERTITVGVISAVGRYGISPFGASNLTFQNFIQTDAQINPGNSGGALADINGKVIGINNMYAQQFAGIGFAIPINLARNVMNQIIETGDVKRGFVGISVPPGESSNITKDIQEALGLPSIDGVLIQDIIPDSPADKAGLEHGDVILTLDKDKIKNFNDFMLKIAEHRPGDTVNLGIFKDGKKKAITLKLSDRDESIKVMTSMDSTSWRGINVVDINNPQAQSFNLGDLDGGVVVVDIEKGSQAADTNLRNGDVIIEINHKLVNNIDDFREITEDPELKKKTVLLYRLRKFQGGQTTKGYIAVKPGD